jgi:hypothetical protein
MKIRTEDLENERYVNLNDLLEWMIHSQVDPEPIQKLKELNDELIHPECGAV